MGGAGKLSQCYARAQPGDDRRAPCRRQIKIHPPFVIASSHRSVLGRDAGQRHRAVGRGDWRRQDIPRTFVPSHHARRRAMLPRIYCMKVVHCCLAILAAGTVGAQGRGGDQPGGGGGGRATWDVTLARGKTRDIDFTTSEGPWMSADLSPDRTWIAFDLLGHIYRMPASGGEATVLTQGSGVALNFQPRISPDGKTIALDRK